MIRTKKMLSCIVAILMVTSLLSYNNANAENNYFYGESGRITWEESGTHYEIVQEVNGEYETTTLYVNGKEDAHFIYNRKEGTLFSSETNQKLILDADFDKEYRISVNMDEVERFSNRGDGTKENPYVFCSPKGSSRRNDGRISYSEIVNMVGSSISVAKITAALIAYFGLGSATGLEIIRRAAKTVFAVLTTSHVGSVLHKKGIIIKTRITCSLLNYKDPAWGDDIWFWGERVSIIGYSTF